MMSFLPAMFLICFVAGALLSLVTLIFGEFTHMSHDGFHIGNHESPDFHDSISGAHLGVGSFFSMSSITMFLTWFGAAGYVLLSRGSVAPLLVILIAIGAGMAGAIAIVLFLHKFLLKGNTRMNPDDYEMPGTLARVTSGIRQGGTGEIVYVKGGTRKVAGARGDDNRAYNRGEEVVIIRYERGIAYVRSLEADAS